MLQDLNLVLFLTASLVVIVAPGPDNILVLTRGISQGRAAAMVSAAGASTGLVCHSLFAAAGLSALLAQSATAFSVVKYAGAAYLLYLGVRTLLSRDAFAVSGGEGGVRLGRVFAQGVASNVMNPKIAVFFLAYLPQFADPASGGLAPQLFLLGLAFAGCTWIVFSVLGNFSGSLGDWLGRRPRFSDALRWLTGGVFVALGLRLALPERG
ncbi:MAG: hypothetical protein AVDCRST_MAG25-2220 [uncultured Rubrobacteraceae bacterium]|uniref:Threonine efflux protein n=1 Tax=uncultured Rubrobacteraceae bacterium TaxID=349277 RepID=A0A6J4RGW8_9ACTN|nr:MAG: hypothetical protein AVDCRST_MAG25-2220 [uncultured Rubrobacteraceae bacterium]